MTNQQYNINISRSTIAIIGVVLSYFCLSTEGFNSVSIRKTGPFPSTVNCRNKLRYLWSPLFSSQTGDSSDSLGAWVPVGSSSSLEGLSPAKIEILGENFAVWKNPATNSWSVMSDICPHRLAPLSQGRINEDTGCVECGYHGWQFQNDGTVVVIPQMDEGKSKTIGKVKPATSFAVHETGDLLWIFLPTSLHGESFPQSLLPEDYYFPGLDMDMARDATYYAQEMPASFHMMIENGLDPAHFSFSHHGVIAKRGDAAPMPDMKVVNSNFTNIDIYTTYRRNGEPRERQYSFQRPFLLYTKESISKSEREEIVWLPGALFFVVPIREGRSRIITSVEKVTKPYLPAWVTHLATRRLFEGDYFVHEAELYRRQKGLKYVEPSTSDIGPRAWNQWMQQHGFCDSPPHTFGLASKENLVPMTFAKIQDPWRIHTSACSKCRAVLRRARKTELWSILCGVLGASILHGQRRSIAASMVLSAGILVHFVAKKIAMLMEGSSHPSDAPERSYSMSVK